MKFTVFSTMHTTAESFEEGALNSMGGRTVKQINMAPAVFAGERSVGRWGSRRDDATLKEWTDVFIGKKEMPEKSFLLALLEDAVWSYWKPSQRSSGKEAQRWILDEEAWDITSFNFICEYILKVDPSRVRAAVLEASAAGKKRSANSASQLVLGSNPVSVREPLHRCKRRIHPCG